MNSIHIDELDLNLIKLFYAVSVEGSVSVAAEKLGVTQSAASHGLRKLREFFDDELFVRAGMTMVPTIRAQELYVPIEQIMNTLAEHVLPAANFNAAASKREFSLVMGDMAEVVFLPPLMRHLQKHAPHCTLRTQRLPNISMLEALEQNKAEIAIGNIPEAQGKLYCQTFFQHSYMVLASADHPRIGATLTWADFAREEHIVVSSGSDVNLREHTLEPLGIKRKIFLTTGGFLSLPWLLRGTELIASVPTRFSQDVITSVGVKHLAMPTPVPPYPLQSLWHTRWHKDPGHRWLRETIFSLMKDYPYIN